MKRKKPNLRLAKSIYLRATSYIETAQLQKEVQWQRETSLDSFSEQDFLREAAWVILCSGFREATVRRIFDYISLSFFDWETARQIVEHEELCLAAAMPVFGNRSKLGAIVDVARRVHSEGFENIRRRVMHDPENELRKLSYVGPVTVWHLAKNLGMSTAKPDRHLERLSSRLGFSSSFEFCNSLASIFDDEVKVVDLVIWRFIADNPAVGREWI